MTNKGFLQGMEMLGEMYEKFAFVLQDEKKASLWRVMLNPLSDEEFKAAVLYHIHTNRFAPTIADIMDAKAKIAANSYTPEEAWAIVYTDISKRGFYDEPTYKDWRLEAAKNAIGWNTLCDMTDYTIVGTRAHFMRIFQSLQEREKVAEITGSESARGALDELVGKLALSHKASTRELEK